MTGERGGSVVKCRTPKREVGGSNLLHLCCVLEHDTLLPESTGNTQESVAPSRHDLKIIDWDVKHQQKTNKRRYDESICGT